MPGTTAAVLTALAHRSLGERCCERPELTTIRAQAAADDLAVLGHPIRLQLLELLSRHGGRMCVCDLVAAVPVRQPTVSHHLRMLRDAGLVDCHKQGLWAYYFVKREALDAVRRRVTGVVADLG